MINKKAYYQTVGITTTILNIRQTVLKTPGDSTVPIKNVFDDALGLLKYNIELIGRKTSTEP